MTAQKSRFHPPSFLFGIGTFVTLTVLYNIVFVSRIPSDLLSPTTSTLLPSTPLPSFLSLALASNTSKVGGSRTRQWRQRYECLYETELAPYRHKSGVKLLELGLGCGMWYGTGASFPVWTEYFHDVTVYYFEWDEKCGREWYKNFTKNLDKSPIMIYGDEEDITKIQKVVSDHGPWDIIIDDASHQSKHQISSFNQLFNAVRPDGIYFIEDINYASFFPHLGGTRNGLSNDLTNTTISYISNILASSILREGIGTNLERLICCDAICAFKAVGSSGQPRIGPKSYKMVQTEG